MGLDQGISLLEHTGQILFFQETTVQSNEGSHCWYEKSEDMIWPLSLKNNKTHVLISLINIQRFYSSKYWDNIFWLPNCIDYVDSDHMD